MQSRGFCGPWHLLKVWKFAVPAARKGVASSGSSGPSNPGLQRQSCLNAPKACDCRPRPRTCRRSGRRHWCMTVVKICPQSHWKVSRPARDECDSECRSPPTMRICLGHEGHCISERGGVTVCCCSTERFLARPPQLGRPALGQYDSHFGKHRHEYTEYRQCNRKGRVTHEARA